MRKRFNASYTIRRHSKNKIMTHIYPNDLKYPTEEEFSIASKNFPKISIFGFKKTNGLLGFLNSDKDKGLIIKEVELYNWDRAFEYRLNNLKRSYIFSKTHFDRGVYRENEEQIEKNKVVNEYMFNYYAEIFYYHIVTLKDSILQIINSFYDCGLEEYQVDNNRLIKKVDILGNEMIDILEEINNDEIIFNKIRNTFTHQFPNNISDNRLKKKTTQTSYLYSIENENGEYYVSGKNHQPEILMNNINLSLLQIDKFIGRTKEIINVHR